MERLKRILCYKYLSKRRLAECITKNPNKPTNPTLLIFSKIPKTASQCRLARAGAPGMRALNRSPYL